MSLTDCGYEHEAQWPISTILYKQFDSGTSVKWRADWFPGLN